MSRAISLARHRAVPALFGTGPETRARVVLACMSLVLMAALALHLAHTVLDVGGNERVDLYDNWLYCGVLIGGAVTCATRAMLIARERAVWALFALGLLVFSAAEVIGTVLPEDYEPPIPSVIDALWLGSYVCMLAGLIALVRARVREFRWTLLVDGLIGGLAIAAVASALALGPILDATPPSWDKEVLFTLAYPIGDLLLLAFVVAALTLGGWRLGGGWALIGAAIATWALADGIYVYELALGTFADGTYLDSLYLLFPVLMACAAWQGPAGPNRLRLDGWRLLAMPIGFAVLALVVPLYGEFEGQPPVTTWLVRITLLAVIVRLALTLWENLRMLRTSRHEALTDGLTGLRNRRCLIGDLELALARHEASLLALFDLDGFKRYNDTYGHAAGDALLERLGGQLATAIDDGPGRAYRMGGDEFCVIVPQGRHADAGIALAAETLTDRGEGFRSRARTASSGSRRRPTRRRTRCGSPTGGCTRARAAVAARGPTARRATCSWRRCASASRPWARTSTASPTSRARSGDGSACRASRSRRPPAPPSCTTSARWPCPRRSSRSRARSRPRSGPTCASTR